MVKDKQTHGLPSDIESCHKLIRELKEQILLLQEQVRQLNRTIYGRKSEKRKPEPENDILSNSEQSKLGIEAESMDIPVKENKIKKHGGGGRLITASNNKIEEETKLYELNEEKRYCPECSTLRDVISTDTSYEQVFVPAKFIRVAHVKHTYACKSCKGQVVTAKRSEIPVIKKGACDVSLLAHIITSKFQDHLPFYRLEDVFKRGGANIARSSMCRWLAECAQQLKVIYGLIKERITSGDSFQADETPLKYLVKGMGKMGKALTGYIWTYLGGIHKQYVAYEFKIDRKGINPSTFLLGYSNYLQTDAYTGYNMVVANEKIKHLYCMAHARRYFEQSLDNHQALANEALDIIAELYKIENTIKDLTEEEKFNIRQREALPILNRLQKWLSQDRPDVIPKSSIAKAISYATKHFDKLKTYIDKGFLAIDNNAAERSIRPIAVGRKNWLFLGHKNAGQTFSILASIVNTCKINSVDTYAYLVDVLRRLKNNNYIDLNELLPDNWVKNQT